MTSCLEDIAQALAEWLCGLVSHSHVEWIVEKRLIADPMAGIHILDSLWLDDVTDMLPIFVPRCRVVEQA